MENKEISLPPDFEPVKDDDIKKEECIFEVFKSENYDKILPNLIKAIDTKITEDKVSEDYPYFNSKNPVKYLPKLDTPSEILNNIQLKEIHTHLPYFHQYVSLYRLFSISVDGSALKSLYKKCEGIKNSILIIKDDEGNVFGAYASDVFYPSSTFCGSPDSFLFTFYKEDKIHVYKSTEINNHYMYCDNEQICFGNTDDYFSLSLKNNLLDGYSKTTTTYQNKPLNDKDKFIIVKLEVWGFKEK
jgi:hypothetical protein